MADHLIVGHARVVDAPGFGFPDTRLVQDHRTLAELGRLSWFNVFFGPGQLVVLPDGTRWRVRAFSRSRWVCPMVAVEGGGAIARSGPGGDRTYGINTRDHAYSLSPAEARRGRARRWMLVEHETEVATFGRRAVHGRRRRAGARGGSGARLRAVLVRHPRRARPGPGPAGSVGARCAMRNARCVAVPPSPTGEETRGSSLPHQGGVPERSEGEGGLWPRADAFVLLGRPPPSPRCARCHLPLMGRRRKREGGLSSGADTSCSRLTLSVTSLRSVPPPPDGEEKKAGERGVCRQERTRSFFSVDPLRHLAALGATFP